MNNGFDIMEYFFNQRAVLADIFDFS